MLSVAPATHKQAGQVMHSVKQFNLKFKEWQCTTKYKLCYKHTHTHVANRNNLDAWTWMEIRHRQNKQASETTGQDKDADVCTRWSAANHRHDHDHTQQRPDKVAVPPARPCAYVWWVRCASGSKVRIKRKRESTFNVGMQDGLVCVCVCGCLDATTLIVAVVMVAVLAGPFCPPCCCCRPPHCRLAGNVVIAFIHFRSNSVVETTTTTWTATLTFHLFAFRAHIRRRSAVSRLSPNTTYSRKMTEPTFRCVSWIYDKMLKTFW